MSDELMPFDLPQNNSSIIKVLGVGGGGSNAVNHMFHQGIQDVNFIICNTDAQALSNSPVPLRVQLGPDLTDGRGAGNKPDIGRKATNENLEDVISALGSQTKMVFITAGMGGGTGTGSAPVIAKATKDLGMLTVAIVTWPFRFEGQRRLKQASEGITELSKHVDSLLVINNEKLREIYGDLKISDAFSKADNILTVAAKGIAEIITIHGHLNVDFADVQTVMTNSGVALMGQGYATGDDRALIAVQMALNSPLLNNNDIRGAKNILLNISSGHEEATMDEIGQINDFVQESAGFTADLIWGNNTDENLGDKISVTVIATGFETDIIPEVFNQKEKKKTIHKLEDKPIATNKKRVKEIEFEVDDTRNIDKQNLITDNNDIFSFSNEDESLQMPEVGEDTTIFSVDTVSPELESDDSIENITLNQESPQISRVETLNKENRANYLKDIDKLENEPAFKRKGINPNNNQPSKENKVSNYSISDKKDGGLLNSNNSYLHDRVD